MKKAAATRRVSRKPPPVKVAKKKKGPEPEVDPALPLSNTKWETVVSFVLKGLSQTDAYLAVYGGDRKSAEGNAARLIGKDTVKARLEFLKAAVTEKVVERVVLDKEAVVKWCLEVKNTPITTIAHAVHKHQLIILSKPDAEGNLPAEVELLTEEEEAALRLAHKIKPSEYGLQVESVGKMDSMKLAVDVLGLKKEDETASKVVDGLAALVAAVRSRSTAADAATP